MMVIQGGMSLHPAKFKKTKIMKINYKPELYKKTVDILFDAYFNDTLSHAFCTSCAVGNIVAANLGYSLKKSGEPLQINLPGGGARQCQPFAWHTPNGEEIPAMGAQWWRVIEAYRGEYETFAHTDELDATGYTINEIDLIERGFEKAPLGKCENDWMFNGLVAVLEVLKQIHKVTEDEETLPRFKKHYEKILAK